MRPLDEIRRLEAYVERTRRDPFVWGKQDCALWVAGAVEAMTGRDLAEPFRGRYKTKAEGIAIAETFGFVDHVDVFRQMLDPVPPGNALLGDVIVIPPATIGIAQGRAAWAMTERGLALVPIENATEAFRP